MRYSGVVDDKYFTCASDQEMDDVDAARGHGRRSAPATNVRERVSGQGGESRRSCETGDRECQPSVLRRRKKERRSFGRRSSSSESDEGYRWHNRADAFHPRRTTEHSRRKSVRGPNTSRRRRTPHSASSDQEGSKEKRPQRQKLSSHSERPLANVKLGKYQYDGCTCLVTVLAKFENCSQCYSLNEDYRIFQLWASLDGPAGQILWDAGKTHSVEDVVTLLRTRFGSEGQPERFRAELKARRLELLLATIFDVD